MAKEKKEGVESAPVTPSSRDRFRERYASRLPDVNMDDEESYYGGANSMLDELEGYEASSASLKELMDRSPYFSRMLVEAGKQENFDPVVFLIQEGLLDLDAMQADKDYAKKIAQAQTDWLEKKTKSEELDAQAEANFPQSMEAIKSKAESMGLSEEQTQEVVNDMFTIFDDMLIGKVSTDLFEMLAKGKNYDTAVAEAREEGVAEGLDTKVKETLRKMPKQSERNGGRQAPIKEKTPVKKEDNMFLA
jgi:hypothetical protein